MVRREDWDQGVAVYMRQRTAGYRCDDHATGRDAESRAGAASPSPCAALTWTRRSSSWTNWALRAAPDGRQAQEAQAALAATERHLKDMQTVARWRSSRDGA